MPSSKKVYLPSTQGLPEHRQAWVDINANMTAVDWQYLFDPNLITNELFEVVARNILDWNLYYDNDEAKLPITVEYIKKLPASDFTAIVTELNGGSEEGLTQEDQKKLILYFTDQYGPHPGGNEPPTAYISYFYRKMFNLSWQDYAATPRKVIVQDLKIFMLEHQVKNQYNQR